MYLMRPYIYNLALLSSYIIAGLQSSFQASKPIIAITANINQKPLMLI